MALTRPRIGTVAAALIIAVHLAGGITQAQTLPQTGAERVSFERTTSHAELLEYLYELQAMTDRMRVSTIATTSQGRSMPLVTLGEPPPADPGTAWFSGKPMVFITGSVHGGERAGKEGSLQLIRELTMGELRPLLEQVNVLIIPSLNPDGAEAGQRTNSLGYDMNRDFIVLETPEISAAVEKVFLTWWPDVYVDAHNGGSYPYNLTYQATLHPSVDEELRAFANGPLFEAVKGHLEAQEMKMFWYSGPRQDPQTGEWAWTTTEPWVRKQHSYGGFHNAVTLLFEAPGQWPLEQQAAAQREGMEALIRFAADHPDQLRGVVAGARRRTITSPQSEVVLGFEATAYPQNQSFWVRERGVAEPKMVSGEVRTLYMPSRTRARPWAYAFDGNLHDIAALLRRHRIEVERLEAPLTVTAEHYRLTSLEYADSPYQNHVNATASVRLVPREATLPAGTYLVRTRQNAGMLAAYLLEPDTDDSLLSWNFLDHVMPRPDPEGERQGSELPIYRIMEPAGVRSTILP